MIPERTISPAPDPEDERRKQLIVERFGVDIGDAGNRWVVVTTDPHFAEKDRQEIRQILQPREVEFLEGSKAKFL